MWCLISEAKYKCKFLSFLQGRVETCAVSHFRGKIEVQVLKFFAIQSRVETSAISHFRGTLEVQVLKFFARQS